MKQLWAPWRMEYLKGPKPKSKCLFCTMLKSRRDRRNLIVYRGERTLIVLNKYPYNNGHLMIVPRTHTADLLHLPDEELCDMSRLIRYAVDTLNAIYRPEGFNIGMNVGLAGGAGISEHLHLHIVPRWLGDTNFMPVLATTKSMPQHLLECYDQVYDHFRRHLSS